MKILYLTHLTWSDIESLPSNWTYYIKDLQKYTNVEIELFNPNTIKSKNIYITRCQIIHKINQTKADILYLNNTMGLNFLVIAKKLKILRPNIVSWKYTCCHEENNIICQKILNFFYWSAFSKIIFVSKRHMEHAIKQNILKNNQATLIPRGVDFNWYQKSILSSFIPQNEKFIVMATGKDSRDYATLCQACEKTQTYCEIYTRRHKNNILISRQYSTSSYIKFIFVEDLKLSPLDEYRFILNQMPRASIIAIPCEKREYGVGYLNVIDALPFGKPILLTYNEDIPLNVETHNLGYLINPYDINNWIKYILKLKQDVQKRINFKISMRQYIIQRYSSNKTTQEIYSAIQDVLKLKSINNGQQYI